MAEVETEEKEDIEEVIANCIAANWSVTRVENLIRDYELSPERQEELLGKVRTAIELKKAARRREKEQFADAEPKQLEFFDKALLRISTKEDQRGLETIVKECIRLHLSKFTINRIIQDMAIDNPDIKDAAIKLDYL